MFSTKLATSSINDARLIAAAAARQIKLKHLHTSLGSPATVKCENVKQNSTMC